MKKIIISISILILTAITYSVLAKKIKITELDTKIFEPLFSANLPNGSIEKYLGYQENNTDFINYFTTTGIALEYLITYNTSNKDTYIKNALNIIDQLENTFDKHGYFPRPAYHHFEFGWVSSMDAPLIALTTLVAYERTNNLKYYTFYEKLIPYLSTTNINKGYILPLSEDKLFPLEYCNDSTTSKDALFVLNGSLVSYLSLSIISKTYRTEQINNLLTKIDNAYKSKFNEFIRENKHWTFYMLNKLTSNQGHYHMFEMKLFSEIYTITGKEMFKEQFQIREKMFKEVYDLKVIENDKNLTYFFLRSTAPHPYMIELYGTILKFYDSKDELIHQDSCLVSGYMDFNTFKNNTFMTGEIPKTTKYYELISVNRGFEKILFKENINDFVKDTKIQYEKYVLSASEDARIEDSILIIDNEFNESVWAKIHLTFKNPIELNYLKYYFIELDNGINKLAMKLTLYDENNRNLDRSIPRMIEGKNLILFSPLGFHSNDEIINIKSITIKIHTGSKEYKDETNFLINHFGILNNEYEVIKYLKNTEYVVNSEL